MFLRKKKKVLAEGTDIAKARAARAEATRDIQIVRQQAPSVNRLTYALARRREMNHFGEEIQVTFTPRGGAA